MADDKQVDFVDGVTPVMASWLDRIQEVEQGLGWNITFNISGTSLVLPAGINETAAGLIIKGKMRLVTAPLSINFTGATVGSYGIWANTTSNDNDPTFTIQAVLGASAPAGVTFTRKLATVSWSGSALSDIVLLAPYVKHSFMHKTGGADPMPSGSVGTTELANDSVTADKIADNSVQPLHLSDALLQKPFEIGRWTSTELGLLGLAALELYQQFQQPMRATGVWEGFGCRAANGGNFRSSNGVNGPVHVIPLTFPNLTGLSRQMRVRYYINYGGVAGSTGGQINIRSKNYPTAFTITHSAIEANPVNHTPFIGVTPWFDATNHGFFDGLESSLEVLEYLGFTAGTETWWGGVSFVYEGRYAR